MILKDNECKKQKKEERDLPPFEWFAAITG